MRRLAEWWEDIGPKGRIAYALLGLVFLFTTLLYCLGITSLMIAPATKSFARPVNIDVETETSTPTVLSTTTSTPSPTFTLVSTPTEAPARPTVAPRPVNTATRTPTKVAPVATTVPTKAASVATTLATWTPGPAQSPNPARPTLTPTPAPVNTPTIGRTATARPSHTLTATPLSRQQHVHIVAAGESLTGIARQYGISVDELAAANGLSSTSLVYTGQRLVIP